MSATEKAQPSATRDSFKSCAPIAQKLEKMEKIPSFFTGMSLPFLISFQQGSFSAPLNLYSVPVFWEKTIHPLRAQAVGMRNANVFWSLLTEASVQAGKKKKKS